MLRESYIKRGRQPKHLRSCTRITRMGARKICWNDGDWAKVVFSDEKCNLDGPDEFQYYWLGLRMDEQLFSKRPLGGGSLMIWGASSSKG